MAAFIVTLVVSLTSLASSSGPFQPTVAESQDRSVLIQAARDLMTKARYCALVTIGADGRPQARAIDAFAPEEDLVVWMATNPVTRKVGEIRRDPRVTLYYFEPSGSGYVTIQGRAEIVTDADAKAARWKESWAAFYANRNRGDDYVLVRVVPLKLEIVSYPHKILNDPKTWRPTTVEFQKDETATAHATGSFEVKLTPQGPGEAADGTTLGRMTLDKTFRGALEGTSRGEMLTAGTPVNGSAGYVAIERVTGTLQGRKGSFILQHTGTMTRGAPDLSISVVPDSGTGELAGLAGKMAITIAGGKHSYDFEYSLPAKP